MPLFVHFSTTILNISDKSLSSHWINPTIQFGKPRVVTQWLHALCFVLCWKVTTRRRLISIPARATHFQEGHSARPFRLQIQLLTLRSPRPIHTRNPRYQRSQFWCRPSSKLGNPYQCRKPDRFWVFWQEGTWWRAVKTTVWRQPKLATPVGIWEGNHIFD